MRAVRDGLPQGQWREDRHRRKGRRWELRLSLAIRQPGPNLNDMPRSRSHRRHSPPRPRNRAQRHAAWVVVIIAAIAIAMVASRVGGCRGASPSAESSPPPASSPSPEPTAEPTPSADPIASVVPVSTPVPAPATFVPLNEGMNVDFSSGRPVVSAVDAEADALAALLKEMADAAEEVTFGPTPAP